MDGSKSLSCDYCGKQIPLGNKHCPGCGLGVPTVNQAASPNPPEVHCPKCCAVASPKARYCGVCGTQLVQETPPSSTRALPIKQPPLLSTGQSQVAQTIPVVMQQPLLPASQPMPVSQTELRQSVWPMVMVICGIIAFLGWLLFSGSTRNSVQSHLKSFQQNLERELNTPNNNYAKHIENIHVTVTYKGGHVKSLSAKTVDGTGNAGVNGRNISEINFVITAYWEGLIQSDGYTEMSITWDNQAKQVKSVSYLDSNAMFNAATVDWLAVGKALGAMIAYAYFDE